MGRYTLICPLLFIFQIKSTTGFLGGSIPRSAERKRGVASLRAGIIDDIGKMASQLRGDGEAQTGRPLFPGSSSGSSSLSWSDLRREAIVTPTGNAIEENKRLWDVGAGPPHTDAKLRLFGSSGEPRVIFYRDTAAWCPYCQKVWMMLEEKKIPYRVEKINMRSYGEKPAWYLAKVPSGLLPAISLDGQLITESLVIMQTLEAEFPEPRRMLPDRGSSEFEDAVRMLNLERKLFSWWCQFVFGFGESGRQGFEDTLDEVNAALASSPGPWFLPSSAQEAATGSPDDGFSLVDLTYVPHLERMAASTAYWKGLQLRGNSRRPPSPGARRWSSINRWFEALEMRATYMATKSDFYTHIKDIPPQYGNGQGIPQAADMKATIDGNDGSWSLPLPPLHPSEASEAKKGVFSNRHEAAYKLTANAEAVARFACRGAGRGSGWSLLPGRAPLSDPNAIPNLDVLPDVDYCLRKVASALLKGDVDEDQASLQSGAVSNGGDSRTAAAVVKSLAYLRDRVGVPRDLSYTAARQFRSHLNWAIEMLRS
ncbi:unnamed protein product [Ascophyllum nodosum]